MSGKSISFTGNDSTPDDIVFSSDGTKLFVLGEQFNKIYRYTCSIAWDISTAIFDTGQELSVAGQATNPRGLYLKSDGLKIFVHDYNLDDVYMYVMSSAHDLTSATYTTGDTFDISSEAVQANSLAFSSDGLKAYVGDSVSSIAIVYEYDLNTAWDLGDTVTYNSNNKNIDAELTNAITGLYFGDGGTKMFACNYTTVYRYTLSVAWDITTAVFDAGQSFTLQNTGNNQGIFFRDNGLQMYSVDSGGSNEGFEYALSVAWDLTTAVHFEINVAGTVSKNVTIAATGTSDHIFADGAVSRSIAASSTGRVDIHADGVLSRSLSMAATGFSDHIFSDGSVSITPAISSTAEVNAKDNGAVIVVVNIAATASGVYALHTVTPIVLPSLTSTGYLENNFMSMPSMTATGQMDNEEGAELLFPSLTALGSGLTGNIYNGAPIMPAVTGVGFGDNSGSVTLPKLTAAGTGFGAITYAGDMTLPALTTIGFSGDDRILVGAITLPSITVVGAGATGILAFSNTTIPAITVYSKLLPGTVATGAVTIPALTIDNAVNAMISQNLITGAATLPPLYMVAYGDTGATLTFSGWVINTENLRTSEYDNYNYLALADIFDKKIGVSSNGIFELTGNKDGTSDINSDVLFGFDSFRTEDLKRIKTIHLGYRADSAGDLKVQIVVDGEDKIREYTLKNVSHDNGIKRGRAKIAKGLKSRYWQYGFKNVLGADFQVDDLNISIQQHNRKAQ